MITTFVTFYAVPITEKELRPLFRALRASTGRRRIMSSARSFLKNFRFMNRFDVNDENIKALRVKGFGTFYIGISPFVCFHNMNWDEFKNYALQFMVFRKRRRVYEIEYDQKTGDLRLCSSMPGKILDKTPTETRIAYFV